MKQKLQEKFIVGSKDIKRLSLTESTSIVEKDGEKYTCRGAYEVPVWRLGEKNLNERIYPNALGERLVQESAVTLGLANHPKAEADVRDTFAVEKNPHIRDGILYVDAYFVGENGKLANEIIEAGGQIGLSSSAYGELDSTGTIIVEGFEIERFCDWVDSPSYEVYAGKTSKIASGVTESIEEKELEEKVLKVKKQEKEEIVSKEKDPKLTIEEKNFKLGIKHLLKGVAEITDLKEKITAYNEILEYCDGVGDVGTKYIEDAQNKIKEINDEIYALAEKAKEVDSLKDDLTKVSESATKESKKSQKSIDLLEKKYDKAKEMLDDMKIRELKVTEMYKIAVAEKNTMVSATEYKELSVFAESKLAEIDRLRAELMEAKKLSVTLTKKIERQNAKRVVNVDKSVKEVNEDAIEETVIEKEIVEIPDNFKNDSVKFYYEDLKFANPRVAEIKSSIMKCRTLFEAQKVYLNLRDLVDNYVSPIKEIKEEVVIEEDTVYTEPLKIKKGWN